MASRPTLDEVRKWPAAVTVREAAAALGISKPHAYNSVHRGDFPARVIKVGGAYRVVSADIVALLEPAGRAA